MADKAFDRDKVERGIRSACESFDELGLNLFERWWVARCVEKAAAAMLGDKVSALREDEKPA